VYPLVTAHCASCHTSTNMPFFATMDPQADHDALVTGGKVNLDNPAMSRLVQRLGQDSHNCWSTCASNSSDMQAAIAKWATLLKAAPTSSTSTATATGTTPAPRMNTIETVGPANIPGPGGATFATMTWPLTSAADTITPDVTGASFTLEIQKFDAFSYLVRNPRVISPSSAVYVSDVRISVNGVIRANDTTYSLLDQIAPMSATGTVISPASMVTLMDKGAGIDKIAISFAQVKANAAGGCKNLAGWQASVKTVFQAACVRCHNAGNSFDMVTGTDAQICVRTLGRVDVNFPSNSRLITYPLTGTGHAGGGNLINQTTANSWVNWINSER
jgi:mono/diheme cytochrome c family protein